MLKFLSWPLLFTNFDSEPADIEANCILKKACMGKTKPLYFIIPLKFRPYENHKCTMCLMSLKYLLNCNLLQVNWFLSLNLNDVRMY